MSIPREHVHTLVDNAIGHDRYMVAVWYVAPGPKPETGEIESRVFMPDPIFWNWSDHDFPTALAQLKQHFSQVLQRSIAEPKDGSNAE